MYDPLVLWLLLANVKKIFWVHVGKTEDNFICEKVAVLFLILFSFGFLCFS